jgi:hypothetical protein
MEIGPKLKLVTVLVGKAGHINSLRKTFNLELEHSTTLTVHFFKYETMSWQLAHDASPAS